MSLFSIDRSLLLSRQPAVEGFPPTNGPTLHRLSLDDANLQELPDLQLPQPGTYDLRQIVLDGVARFNPEYDLSGEPGHAPSDLDDTPPDLTGGLQVTTRLIVGSVQPTGGDGIDFEFPDRDFADAFLGSRDDAPVDIPEGPIGIDGMENPDFGQDPTEPNTILDTPQVISFPPDFFIPRDPIEVEVLNLEQISPVSGLEPVDPSDVFSTDLADQSSLPTLSLQRAVVPDADPIVLTEPVALIGVATPAGDELGALG